VISLVNLDAGSDNPNLARIDIYAAMQAVYNILTCRNAVNGIAGLDENGKLYTSLFPTTPISVGGTGATTKEQALINLGAQAALGYTPLNANGGILTGKLEILRQSPKVGLLKLIRKDNGTDGADLLFFHDSDNSAVGDIIARLNFTADPGWGVANYGAIRCVIEAGGTYTDPKGKLILGVLGTTGKTEADIVHGLHVIAGGIKIVSGKSGDSAGTIWIGDDVTISSARKFFGTGLRIEGLTSPNGKIAKFNSSGDLQAAWLTDLAAQIDFHYLPEATPASDDEICIWDTSASAYRKAAVSDIGGGGGGGGVTDHGALTGLSHDDHTQYLDVTRHDTPDRHALGTVVPHDAFLGLTDTPANYTGAAGKTVVVNSAANALEFVTAGGPWYGDGSDGDVALDGTNTFSWATKNGGTYALNRPVYANNIVVSNGAVINPNGYHLYVRGTLTGALKVYSNGGNGGNGGLYNTGGTAGTAAHGAGSLPAVLAGKAGQGSGGGVGLTGNTQTSCDTNAALPGAAGGAGGVADGYPTPLDGGAGGTVSKLTFSDRSIMSLLTMRLQIGPTLGQWNLHGGGGSGAPGRGSIYGAGGGSGGNGGNSVICVRDVLAGASIDQQCKGGTGGGGGGIAPNEADNGGGGGGAGGSGGVAICLYGRNAGTITQSVAGGTGGPGGTGFEGNGQAGGNGPSGLAVLINAR
jgi:hypothetical protein